MTLPEIPKEESKEQIIKTCPDCGKPCKNLGVHKRYCKESKDKAAMKQEPLLESPTVSPPSTPAEPILVISNVQPYIGDYVAWFEGQNEKYYLEPNYIGIVNNIPMVLVLFTDGAIVPPHSLPGFLGMFPRDANFVISNQSDDVEPFPPFPEEEEEPKQEIKPQLLEEKVSFTIESKPEEKPKKSWWPFSHKKADKPVTPKADTTELKNLVNDAMDAGGY